MHSVGAIYFFSLIQSNLIKLKFINNKFAFISVFSTIHLAEIELEVVLTCLTPEVYTKVQFLSRQFLHCA